MKFKQYCLIANLLLLVAVLGLSYILLSADKPPQITDRRQAIQLDPAERGFVLGEMRGFLSTVQGITAAISRQQMETVANLAKASGTATPAPTSLSRKLPLEFKQIGLSVHRDFDQLALDAEQLRDPANSLRQLADITAKCLACHDSYRLQTAQP